MHQPHTRSRRAYTCVATHSGERARARIGAGEVADGDRHTAHRCERSQVRTRTRERKGARYLGSFGGSAPCICFGNNPSQSERRSANKSILRPELALSEPACEFARVRAGATGGARMTYHRGQVLRDGPALAGAAHVGIPRWASAAAEDRATAALSVGVRAAIAREARVGVVWHSKDDELTYAQECVHSRNKIYAARWKGRCSMDQPCCV